MNKAPTLSDLFWNRMEVRAMAGKAIAAKAKRRGALTTNESYQMRLMKLDQDDTRRQWANALRSEGHYVSTLDYESNYLTTGVRVNAVDRGRPRIWLYGEIGDRQGGIIADDLRRAFAEVPNNKDVELHIHSDGGDYSEGVAMHSIVEARQGRTIGVVDGRACSAATFPLMACSEVVMTTGSWLMIHEASGSVSSGRLEDFERATEVLAETNRSIAEIYRPRWRGSMESLRQAMMKETWFAPTEAISAGLADSISDRVALAASVNRRHSYKNIPATLSIAARYEDRANYLAACLCLHRCAIVH